jgi:hypothetical protein
LFINYDETGSHVPALRRAGDDRVVVEGAMPIVTP